MVRRIQATSTEGPVTPVTAVARDFSQDKSRGTSM
jgi:hypothetical protein